MELIILTPITYFALFAIVVIGLPHGSLDGAIASFLGFKSIKSFSKFLFLYVFISIVVILFWFYYPLISLFLFLFISIYHFGSCDAGTIKNKFNRLIMSIAHGGSVVLGVVYFHKFTSFKIFEYLSGPDVYLFIHLADYFFYLILLFVCIYFYLCLKNNHLFKKFMEIPLMLLIAYFAHPLVSFSIYFCCIHTPRHIIDVIKNLKQKNFNYKKIILTTIIFTMLSWLLGLIGYLYLLTNSGNSESILKVIFIGLAALTLPHMILVDGFYKPKTRKLN
tara:strand:+ start:565 stop:1395 length:831 start_codon:yes stop_codon:yes gene_type:complete